MRTRTATQHTLCGTTTQRARTATHQRDAKRLAVCPLTAQGHKPVERLVGVDTPRHTLIHALRGPQHAPRGRHVIHRSIAGVVVIAELVPGAKLVLHAVF